MMDQSRRDDVRLRHMLDYARETVELSRGRLRTDLDADRLYQLAMMRVVEVIGEAASRVSVERRERHSEVPWPNIIEMRNRIFHGYDVLNLDILWETISESMPSLIAALEPIVTEIDRRNPPPSA